MSGADVDVAAVEAYMGDMYRQFVNDPFANRQYARLVDEVIASAQAGERLPSDAAREALVRFFLADEAYLRAAYDEAERLFGSFDAYLSQAVLVDDVKRHTLRNLLLSRDGK